MLMLLATDILACQINNKGPHHFLNRLRYLNLLGMYGGWSGNISFSIAIGSSRVMNTTEYMASIVAHNNLYVVYGRI